MNHNLDLPGAQLQPWRAERENRKTPHRGRRTLLEDSDPNIRANAGSILKIPTQWLITANQMACHQQIVYVPS